MDYKLKVKEYNAEPPPVDNFKGVTKSNPIRIRDVKINDKGSLEVMRERLLAGESFPIGDFIKVAADGKGGWTMIKYDEKEFKKGNVEIEAENTYSSTDDFVKNGLNSTSPGFQNLKQYGEKEKIVLTDEEKEAGIKIYGDGNPYKLDEDDGLYYLYTR